MSEPLDRLIAAYHDGTLDADGAELLAAALRGRDAESVRGRLAMDGLLTQVFTADDAMARSVMERIRAERSASAMVRAVRQALPARARRRALRASSWGSRLTVAALLTVVVAAGWLLVARVPATPALAVECRVESEEPLTIQRGETSIIFPTGGGLAVGDRLGVPRLATLRWSDGSHLILGAGSVVEITRPGRGPGCHLLAGAGTAVITPQRAGAPFTIATPESHIEVLGTRFRVVAGARATRVDLHEGLVRLTRASDQRTLTLRPDEFAVVAVGEEFIVRSGKTPAPQPPPPPPAPAADEPAWQPLFAASGLADWQQQHGRWSNTDGRIHGHDPRGGKARLLGRQPFADLELDCRLRITGAEFAEVQVGDYNWFAEVRGRRDEWVQVTIRQRGRDLTITADGVELPLQAGDGKAMRAGPLAFYVMPGGTLEIADARYRIPPLSPATPTTR